MLNPCIGCEHNKSVCITCFEKEVIKYKAEIAELKDKLFCMENTFTCDKLSLEDKLSKVEEKVKNREKDLAKAYDTIGRRNALITDLRGQINKRKEVIQKMELFLLAYTPVEGQEKDYLNVLNMVKSLTK